MNYSRQVTELFDATPHAGRLEAGPRTAIGAAGVAERGVRVEFSIGIQGDRIAEARFRCYGCPHAIAAASRVAGSLQGQPLAAADALDPLALGDALGVPVEKLGVLLVVEDALRACIGAWRARAATGGDTWYEDETEQHGDHTD